MLRLRRENVLIRDDKGYASGCIADITPSERFKNTLDVIIKADGTQGKITMHVFPSIVISNRMDDQGNRNLMTTLCLKLGLFNEDDLIADKIDFDSLNDSLQGMLGSEIKFKTIKARSKDKDNKKATNLETIDVSSIRLNN